MLNSLLGNQGIVLSENRKSGSSAKLDATGEFFSVGAPLHALRSGYVRRAADDQLFDALNSGRDAHVLAPNRSGKSSLIAATSVRLQSSDVSVAVIDLAQIGERDGGSDAGRWYYNVAYRLLRQLRLKNDLQAWWHDKSMLSNRQRLVEFYIDIILKNVAGRIVIFVDAMECVGRLSFAEHLPASIRAVQNSRMTDPELRRLNFVMLGECDASSLVSHDGLSPFVDSVAIRLTDFSRDELTIFSTELNLPAEQSNRALDRIYEWTNGQPYLTQKLARALSRDSTSNDVEFRVDKLAQQQLAGRAAIRSEPHLNHIHKVISSGRKDSEALLNLYGKLRKGVPVPYVPDARHQRELIAIGLVVVGKDGRLEPRNKIYASVFTAKWANENLPIHWRGPAIAAAIVVIATAVPFWYTQMLPESYSQIISAQENDLAVVSDTYESYRSFPGHAGDAEKLFENSLKNRARSASTREDIDRIRLFANKLSNGDAFGAQLAAEFWDRQSKSALQLEDRDLALTNALESLVVPTATRRRVAANLIGDDYPRLIGTIPSQQADRVLFDPENNLLTFASVARITQWSLSNGRAQQRARWTLSALEVTPLVRRVDVERTGNVRQITLAVGLSHSRLDDLRIRLTAPSGRAVDLDLQSSAAASGDYRFAGDSLNALLNEAMSGVWSLSLRDEASAVPGSLSGWSMVLNGREYVDSLERNLDIPDPAPRESNDVWFSDDGRYAVARAVNSDSARLWDLLYAQPARTIAVPASENVLGLSESRTFLVTARQQAISLWRIADGRRQSTFEINGNATQLSLIEGGKSLLTERNSETETTFEVWSLTNNRRKHKLSIAGAPALVNVSRDGRLIGVADYDRTIRIWEFESGNLVAQVALLSQPSRIAISPNAKSLGVVHGEQGISFWNLNAPETVLFSRGGRSNWNLSFSPSGTFVVAGNSEDGYQVYQSDDGSPVGPPMGTESNVMETTLLAFSQDEELLLTANTNSNSRFWRAPSIQSANAQIVSGHEAWKKSGDSIATLSPSGHRIAVGDSEGHVHVLSIGGRDTELELAREDVNFIGHKSPVAALMFSNDESLIASVDTNGEVRIWDADSGRPRKFRSTSSTSAVEEMAFSPNNQRLAILAGQKVRIIATTSGEALGAIELEEIHSDIVFSNDSQIFMSGQLGSLSSLSEDRTGNWLLRSVWKSDLAQLRLAIAPNRQMVAMVDSENTIRILNIKEGIVGANTISLPSVVGEILFSANETRLLIRTPRWVHRASVSPSGIGWLDAIRIPKIADGSELVFGSDQSGNGLGSSVYVLTRDTGSAEVAELSFQHDKGASLIGTREELLQQWRTKLAAENSRR